MADRSAALLLELLLDPQRAGATGPLARQLAVDPPLVLWAVCVESGQAASAACSIEDVARPLAAGLRSRLRWQATPDVLEPAVDAARRESFAELVGAAIGVAELAGRLVAPAAREAAYLLGLLHDAPGMLKLAAEAGSDPCDACLPDWLLKSHAHPAMATVRQAQAILTGQQPAPDAIAPQLADCRRAAVEGRQNWLAPAGFSDAVLPLLAERLARLEQLQERFQEAVEAGKLEALAEFAAGAGHEINNPLTVITGRAQLLLREEADPERRRSLALVNTQAMRVHEMIADMRLFARPPAPERQQFELAALVERVLAELGPQAAEQQTQLRRTGQPGPLMIHADPAQWAVALRALCTNALEALERGGTIEVDLRRTDRQVELRVTDDGPGITSDERRHVFDPFYSARQAGRGLGLGLSKCWRIVTGHGGRIEVESQPGQGATFTITLPVPRAVEGEM